MSKKSISLNGNNWLLKDFICEDWIWRDVEKTNNSDIRWWRKSVVPGSVHNDLWKLDEIPDPYFEKNSLLLEWIPQRTWIYKKNFMVPLDIQGNRVEINFRGIDYSANIYLNGHHLGFHFGMFIPAIFDISEKLNYGEDNYLVVVLDKAPDEQAQVSKTEYVKTHKSRMTYWWDFCPRMIHIGIWDKVTIDVYTDVKIKDTFIRPVLESDLSNSTLDISFVLNSIKDLDVIAEVEIYINNDLQLLKSYDYIIKVGDTKINEQIRLENPKLWYPNGYGLQNLYVAKLFIKNTSNELLDVQEITFGIRKLDLLNNITNDTTAEKYTISVNNKKIYIKGWNWVPIDVMYGVERQEKLERLLQLAKRANVNMLRVWGGGLIEKESFYDLCNEYGIMVWQEFIQSSSGICNEPPSNKEFIEMMVREAEIIVKNKRNHPSLVFWCGGNELTDKDIKPLDNSNITLKALKDVVNKLDPDRFWLATSPTGRLFGNTLENIALDPEGLHDVHGPWEFQGIEEHCKLYNAGTSLMSSEFGVEGMTNINVLNKTISQKNQWPPSRENNIYFHLGSWWNNYIMVQECFGNEINDVETFCNASQFLQMEGLRYAVESNIRRKYQNSATIPWQFNEPYPNAFCTSALDYIANPKLAYYGVKRAYKELMISASFETYSWINKEDFVASIYISNSVFKESGLILEATVRDLFNNKYESRQETISIEPDCSEKIFDIKVNISSIKTENFILHLNLFNNEHILISESNYVFTKTDSFKSLLALAKGTLEIKKEVIDNKTFLHVTNSSNEAIVGLRFDDGRDINEKILGFMYFSDSGVNLMPNESKIIEVEFSNILPDERLILISALNFTQKKILFDLE